MSKRLSNSAADAPGPALALRLHTKIYSARAVQETAEAFGELCDVELAQTGDYHELAITPRDGGDDEELLDEFANYALSRATRNR